MSRRHFRAVPWDPQSESEQPQPEPSTSTELSTETNTSTEPSTSTPTIHSIMWDIIMSRRPPDATFEISPGNNDSETKEEEIEELLLDFSDDDNDNKDKAASGGAANEVSKSETDNNNNSHECPICMETREKYYTLIPCGHVLCSDCVYKIKKKRKKNKCFICRRKAKKKFRIYL